MVQMASVTQRDLSADKSKGSDPNPFAELRAGFDDSGGVDRC
jgi:hypothetical protein